MTHQLPAHYSVIRRRINEIDWESDLDRRAAESAEAQAATVRIRRRVFIALVCFWVVAAVVIVRGLGR